MAKPPPAQKQETHANPITNTITSHSEADEIAKKAIAAGTQLLPKQHIYTSQIGKSKPREGLMWPRTFARNHNATPLLDSYAEHGCPVDCGPNWSTEQIMEALQYGAHPTASLPEARQCLLDETAGKVQNGFARTVRWGDIKNNLPPNFKLSPVAMIPHKSRKYRCILDLSFQLKRKHNQTPFESVNTATTKLAPQQSMNQLGSALKRMIATLADAHTDKREFMFSKLDIKDGFWRMVVNTNDAWNFCYLIPNSDKKAHIDDTTIVVPNSLQMGWAESPPFFCAASETARDVVQQLLNVTLPPHPFEERMLPTKHHNNTLQDLESTTTLIEVYVDDFIAGTDDTTRDNLLRISRAMLHGIHSIFPPQSETGHTGGDPISEKKLDKLEGLWDHVKEILGWFLDGKNFTIYLPQEKVAKVQKTLRDIQKKTKIKIKDLQKIAGILHHASMGIPGGRGLFTTIWTAMANCKNGWVKLTPDLKHTFADFKWLFQEIANKPVSVAQVTPKDLQLHGYTDACKFAAGGVWIIPGPNGPRYIFWTTPFTDEVVRAFTTGTISINDLEMAGILLGWLVLEHLCHTLQFTQAGMECDNSSSVHWTRKYTAKSLIAGHLLRALALRQQICRSAPVMLISIAGELNDMADVASRYATTPSLNTNSPSLASYFNTHFKQSTSWEEFHLNQKLSSRVMSSLLGQRLTLESWRRLPGLVKNTGDTGVTTQVPSRSTRFSTTHLPSYETQSLQHSLQGSGQAITAEEARSRFKASLMRSRPSARPSSWLD